MHKQDFLSAEIGKGNRLRRTDLREAKIVVLLTDFWTVGLRCRFLRDGHRGGKRQADDEYRRAENDLELVIAGSYFHRMIRGK